MAKTTIENPESSSGVAAEEKAPDKRFSFMNVCTFGLWNKYNPGERKAFFLAYNVSSWITLGQVAAGTWVWQKVTLFMPWLVPFFKGVWTKVAAAATSVWHASSVL